MIIVEQPRSNTSRHACVILLAVQAVRANARRKKVRSCGGGCAAPALAPALMPSCSAAAPQLQPLLLAARLGLLRSSGALGLGAWAAATCTIIPRSFGSEPAAASRRRSPPAPLHHASRPQDGAQAATTARGEPAPYPSERFKALLTETFNALSANAAADDLLHGRISQRLLELAQLRPGHKAVDIGTGKRARRPPKRSTQAQAWLRLSLPGPPPSPPYPSLSA